MSATARPLADASSLRHRLCLLRRRLRLVATVRGVSLVLALLLSTALAVGLLDWSVHLPSMVRAVILVGVLTGAGYLAYRYLFRPLNERVDDLTLALRVEESYPALNDSLASTVQFLDELDKTPVGDSAALRREAVRRGLARAAGCDFNRVVDAKGLRSASVSAVAALAVVLPLVFLFPALAGTALARLVNPFGRSDWPRQTQIYLETARLQIGKGEVFDVRGRLGGVIPEQARVVFRFAGFPPQEQLCTVKKEGDKPNQFAARLEKDQVQRSFFFQVFANDAESEELEVKVLPPPVLTLLNGQPSPQVQLYFPAYTDLPSPLALTPGTGSIEAVFGTRVHFQAAADRPLRQAWIEFLPEQPQSLLPTLLTSSASSSPLSCVAFQAGAGWAPVPATLGTDRHVLSVDFLPRISGFYVLFFEDENRLGSYQVFELRLRADPAPTVTLERPSPTRDILSLLPTADLRLQLWAEDVQFALKSVYLRYRTKREDAPRQLFLYNHATARERLLAPIAGLPAVAWNSLKLRPTRLDFQQLLSLKQIKHPDGTSLKEGDVLILQACADDFDDVTPNKQPGVSHEVEIRIVGTNALDLILNQEQAAVQQALLKLREKEREAIQKVSEAEKHLKRGDKLTPEDQERLLEAEQLQQQIHERIGNEEKGLRAEIARIQETLKQNGMQNSAVRDRMADVARELERLADRDLEKVEARLTNARKQVERQAQLEEKAKEIEKQAQLEEQTAKKKQAAEAEAREQAAKAENAEEKARLEADAQRLKQQAETAKQKAEELREKAAAEKKDAGTTATKQQLTDARQHQEEVEKTLNDLLNRLEPWSSAREIKGEAKRLLQEQKQLQAQLEELNNKQQGKKLEELNEQQKADLKNLQEQQQRLEERTNQLLDKMNRLAEERKDKDPETARELSEARQKAVEGDISGQMKAASKQIAENQLNDAQKSQKNSVAELEKMVKNLEDRREAELDRLAKKLKEAEKRLDELKDEQERLAKKIKEVNKEPDEAKRQAAEARAQAARAGTAEEKARLEKAAQQLEQQAQAAQQRAEEELKKLSREQQRLQEKTQELAKQLTRLRADRAGQALGKAGGQMDQAGQQMQKGEKPEDPQEALERLAEAKRELQRARKQAEDELQRELLKVAETLQRLKERQEACNTEAVRIQDEVLRARGWTRPLVSSLNTLGDNQQGLSTETEEVAKKDLADTPVFARMIRRAADAMRDAGERAKTLVKERPALETLPDAELKRHQEEALRRLTQVLEAVKDQAAGNKGPAGGGDGGQGGLEGDGGDGGSGRENPGLPPPAQLKLLKALQQEINQKTDDFQKKHPDTKKLNEAEQKELQGIRKLQQDVVELLEEYSRPADEPADKEGEKK